MFQTAVKCPFLYFHDDLVTFLHEVICTRMFYSGSDQDRSGSCFMEKTLSCFLSVAHPHQV